MSRVLKTQAQNAIMKSRENEQEVCLSVESNAIAVYFSIIY